MTNIILNEDQERIKNKAVEWFRSSSEQVFEIDGPAGTGKSVLIAAILRELNLSINQYLPMAYTGQASIVMRTRGFPTARSIHSSLYELEEYIDENDRLNLVFGKPVKKRKRFVLNKFLSPTICLFFIDEAYMVPKWMVKDILSFGIKVIACGDAHQLPPVGDQPGFLTGYNINHLTKLMRQSENNPIVYLSHRAMNGLPIHTGMYGNDAMVINDTDFIPEMIGFVDCVCCGTNKTRESMNRYVRKLAGYEGKLPKVGERIICRKNNWDISIDGISLANGLAGTVVQAPTVFKGDYFNIDFLPDLSQYVFENLILNYEYFSGTPEVKNEMKSSFEINRYIDGEFFDFAYCLTTHLCQGSEYNNLIYIEEFLNKQIQNQLIYTGITRAKHKLIYIKKTNKYFSFGSVK